VQTPRVLALSDMHLGRSKSHLTTPEQLAPLLDGFDSLMLVGDIIDHWYVEPQQIEDLQARLRAVCDKCGVREMVYCRGNHDAHAPEACEFALRYGILYLHGHAMFDRLKGHGSVEERIRSLNHRKYGAHRTASRNDRVWWKMIERAYGRFPQSVLTPLAWNWYARRRVVKLAGEMGAGEPVRAVVLGHTHCPGFRRVRDLLVFNLGGWMHNTKAFGFVHDGDQARLVRIETRHHELRWGPPRHAVDLTDGRELLPRQRLHHKLAAWFAR